MLSVIPLSPRHLRLIQPTVSLCLFSSSLCGICVSFQYILLFFGLRAPAHAALDRRAVGLRKHVKIAMVRGKLAENCYPLAASDRNCYC
jgi:anthranilate/para-aminobenzoate synthase component II